MQPTVKTSNPLGHRSGSLRRVHIDDEEWLTAAYHEAGHALAYIEFGWQFRYVEVYKDENNDINGHLKRIAGKYSALRLGIACLAGPMAEARFTGTSLFDVCVGGGLTDLQHFRAALDRVAELLANLLALPLIDQFLIGY